MLCYRSKVLFVAVMIAVLALPSAVHAEGAGGFVTETGNFLTGKVVKKSGIEREGVISMKTAWSYPSPAPVIRYDFDLLHGIVEGRKYSYLMGDIAEVVFLPPTDGPQRLDITLRNGAVIQVELTSGRTTMFGNVGLSIENVVVETDGFGRNIVPVTEIAKVVFDSQADVKTRSMADLVEDLGKAIEMGSREDLVDEELSVVLKNIQERMKARLKDVDER